MRAIVEAVAPKPVNVLISRPLGFTLADVAATGVRRVSQCRRRVGRGRLGRLHPCRESLAEGSFEGFTNNAACGRDLNALFADKS